MRRSGASVDLKLRVTIIAGVLTILVRGSAKEKRACRSDEISVKSL
jgi:hypothetical protein